MEIEINVTLKPAKEKVVKLSEAEARELYNKLSVLFAPKASYAYPYSYIGTGSSGFLQCGQGSNQG